MLFTGSVPFESVPSYIASFDIGTTPDPSNPYSDSCTTIKTMEYMALGKPTVAFDTVENRITGSDAAIFVSDNDERAFAKALAALMDDADLRKSLGRSGRQRIDTSLSWRHQQEQLLAVYRSWDDADGRHVKTDGYVQVY